MRMVKLICIIGILGLVGVVQAHAGAEGGGGGNAIVCFKDPKIPAELRQSKQNGNGWIPDKYVTNNNIVSVELLDYAEAKIPTGGFGQEITPSLIEANPNENIDQFLSRLKDRLKPYLPALPKAIEYGQRYLGTTKKFEHGLSAIDDVGPGESIDTEHCVRVTIIGQFDKGYEHFIGYDSRIFGLSNSIFSITNQTLSFAHEYAYFYPRTVLHQETSDNTRTVISQMIVKDVNLLKLFVNLESISDPRNGDANCPSCYSGETFVRSLLDILHSEWRKVAPNYPLSYPGFSSSQCTAKMTAQTNDLRAWYTSTVEPQILNYQVVPSKTLQEINELIKNGLSFNKDPNHHGCNMNVELEPGPLSFYPDIARLRAWLDFTIP